MATITGEIRESTAWSIVLSALMMISGVLAIFIPPTAGLAVTLMFGWLLIFNGVLHLGFAWRAAEPQPSSARSFSLCCTRRLASRVGHFG